MLFNLVFNYVRYYFLQFLITNLFDYDSILNINYTLKCCIHVNRKYMFLFACSL